MKVFVRSFGCATNMADGEVMAGCLVEADYSMVNSVEAADVIVFNTCAVKGPTEDRVIAALKRVPKSRKLVVTGCLPLINGQRLEKEIDFDGVAGPAPGRKIVRIVDRVSQGEKVTELRETLNSKPGLLLPRVRANPTIGIVPIGYGCLGSCAYCCVSIARGRLRSYSIDEIRMKLEQDLSKGVREFWLTSQDTACYGVDKNTSLPHLLESLVGIEGRFMIRIGMMTPDFALEILDDLVDSFADKKVFEFLHLPLQSGDNQVLETMQRRYSVQDFQAVVKSFRTRFRHLTLATDIICGFPGESEESFKQTLRLIGQIEADIVNVSKFFARPGTQALSMREDLVPVEDIKRRTTSAAEFCSSLALRNNRRWKGWIGSVLIDEAGKVPDSWVGRNFAYKPIVLKEADTGSLLGKFSQVRVTGATKTHLWGQIVRNQVTQDAHTLG